jgi:hypothetical protein
MHNHESETVELTVRLDDLHTQSILPTDLGIRYEWNSNDSRKRILVSQFWSCLSRFDQNHPETSTIMDTAFEGDMLKALKAVGTIKSLDQMA